MHCHTKSVKTMNFHWFLMIFIDFHWFLMENQWKLWKNSQDVTMIDAITLGCWDITSSVWLISLLMIDILYLIFASFCQTQAGLSIAKISKSWSESQNIDPKSAILLYFMSHFSTKNHENPIILGFLWTVLYFFQRKINIFSDFFLQTAGKHV